MIKTASALFLSGLLLGSGPCLASCAPLLVSYLAASDKNIRSSLFAYFLFSAGRIIAYLLLGFLVFRLGQFILENLSGSWSAYILIGSGSFIAGLGLLLIFAQSGKIRFCSYLQDFFLKKDKKTLVSLGLSAGILPCLPLFSVLYYIGLVAKSWPLSLFYALAFGLGTFFSPLLLFALLGASFSGILKGRPRINRILRFSCGLILIALGAQLILRGS
jgi:sulfite exporter TauE/SafE